MYLYLYFTYTRVHFHTPTYIFTSSSYLPSPPTMGRVRTRTVKRSSKTVIEKYYPRLSTDFHTNKRLIDEVAIVPSKRLRNKIAGYTSHLMKRLGQGEVRGISFALQEEERERKDNYVPEVSQLAKPIEIDPDTKVSERRMATLASERSE